MALHGIRIQGGFGGKNGSLGNFSSNGGLANANSVMVEGLALDLAQMNSPSFVPPVDSTQEFRVQTNSSRQNTAGLPAPWSTSASSPGPMTFTVGYEFLRNKVLNANNFFQNRAGIATIRTHSESIRRVGRRADQKDKTFFFANWEEYRNRTVRPQYYNRSHSA